MHRRTNLALYGATATFLVLAAGCGGGKDTAAADPTGTEPTGDTDTEPTPVTADYTGDQYVIEDFGGYASEDDGIDLDGDGDGDNATPDALVLVDAFVKYDMTVEGLNGTIAGAINDGQLIILMETAYDQTDLSVDILTGTTAGSGAIAPDPSSYDKAGDPLSRLQGFFTSDTEFYATADRIQVGVTFFPKDPPLPLPIEMVTAIGEADENGISGDLYGAIPADDLLDLLIIPLLEDSVKDPKERQSMIDLIEGVLDYPTVTDIDLGGGRRGVSCAFYFDGSDITW